MTALLALLRVWRSPSFYYADDTQLGAVGLWWHLGDRLLAGEVPSLNPSAWQAGNYWAEGQWGLINPMTWLIAVGMRLSDGVLVYATAIKIALLILMAVGAHLLARSFRANLLWSSVAGVMVPAAGFTVYMDSTSWVTGLMTTALFPWVWWSIRRVLEGRGPWLYLLSSYMLITAGYVFGTIVLVVLLCALLGEALIRRAWSKAWRVLLGSLWGGFWTVVVYLPGILTAPVTVRGTLDIVNALFLNADISDIGAMSMPLATATIGSWHGAITPAPLVYVTWLLPVLLLVRPWRRGLWGGTASLLLVGGAALMMVLGPSDVGPIRWPMRFMPYLALAVVVVVAVLLTRGFPQRVTRRSLMASLILSAVSAWLCWATAPMQWGWAIASFLIVAAATVALFGSAHKLRTSVIDRIPSQRRAYLAVAAIVVAVTAGSTLLQLRVFPTGPLPTLAAPATAEPMRHVLSDTRGDVVTVGDARALAHDPEAYRESLIANLWYFSDAEVANTYTVVPHSNYSADLCMDLRGNTCAHALDLLLSTDPSTGARVADLLAVSEILVYAVTHPEPPVPLPQGWREASKGETVWRIVRDEPVASAGGVTWAGHGTVVTELHRSDSELTLRVDSVGEDSRVVLSRLDWPGYSVQHASFAPSTRGYLLTLDLADVPVGTVVPVVFRPPGFALTSVAAVMALLLAGVWSVVSVVHRRRETAASSRPAPTAR